MFTGEKLIDALDAEGFNIPIECYKLRPANEIKINLKS